MFWEIVEAIEGPEPVFQCKNIKANGYLYREKKYFSCGPCTIHLVMLKAEEQMRNYLRGKTLSWMNKELDRVLPAGLRKDTRSFFNP